MNIETYFIIQKYTPDSLSEYADIESFCESQPSYVIFGYDNVHMFKHNIEWDIIRAFAEYDPAAQWETA